MAEAIFNEEDRYSCAICLDLLKDPVTIPCGHSYCMSCIEKCWNNMEAQKGFYSCPQCRHTYHLKPSLNRSTVLAEIMDQVRDTQTAKVSKPAHSLAGHGDIECDLCHGRKIKAVKSCLECQVSYCEEHIHPHYNVPALKKHKLTKPYILPKCAKHDKLLEVYCRTDQKCVCMPCLMDDHKGHDTVPSSTERNEKQIKLTDNQKKLKQEIQAKTNDLQKMTNDIKSHSLSAKKTVQDSMTAFTELARLIETRSTEVLEKIKAHEKADLDQGSNLKEKLTQEITELKRRDGALETFLQTEDNIHFLQHFESVASSSESDDFPSLSFKPCSSFVVVSKLVSELKERLETILNEEINETSKKISDLFLKSSTEVKIGDRVRVKLSVQTPKHDWGNVTHNSVGVVKDINEDGGVIVNFPGHANWKGILSEMELVTDNGGDDCDNPVFKPGSTVRVKASVKCPEFGWGEITQYSTGIVTAVDGNNVTVDFPEHSGWTGRLCEMELVSHGTRHDTDKTFQTGARVCVKGSVSTPEYGWGDVTKKSVGIVKAVCDNEVTVDFPEHSGWTGLLSEIELVSDDNTDNFSLCPGMSVRVNPSIREPVHGWGCVTKDSIGVVKAINGAKVTVNFPEQSEWSGIISELEAV